MSMKITIDDKILHQFCKENNIKKLSFFGSVLTDKFSEKSDIDVLVEFEDESKPGFLGIAKIERELSQLFNQKVDLKTINELSHYFREKVVKEAEVRYG